jgi:cellulose synthase/poly-beta-1,6-N-acetylglucosamine synthase-like glycosyltransferase
MFRVSIGIMAYNEGINIGKLLDSLILQKTFSCEIIEIIVVASGCTDNTEEIVREKQKKDNRIILIVQEKREGKASAINLFLKRAKGEILILSSADILPFDEFVIEKLVKPFYNKEIGAAGVHPIPVNKSSNFIGFYVNLFWKLHHQISLIYPKCGEMVAFRNILPEIAYDTATDETWIIALLNKMNYKVAYVEDAKIVNKGPETVSDFFKQRRRHLVGYIHLKKELNFQPKTLNVFLTLKLLPRCIKINFREIIFTLGVIFLEGLARILAKYDWYVKKENPYIWKIAKSTKEINYQDVENIVKNTNL